jgi:hypothetical protein
MNESGWSYPSAPNYRCEHERRRYTLEGGDQAKTTFLSAHVSKANSEGSRNDIDDHTWSGMDGDGEYLFMSLHAV